MEAFDDLHIQYDFLSRTVLVELRERSHVLRGDFRSKEAAEFAAMQYAARNWRTAPDTRSRPHRLPLPGTAESLDEAGPDAEAKPISAAGGRS